MAQQVFRTCPLCEACCGLAFEVERDGDRERVTGVAPDPDDVLSHGFVCPKGMAMGALHDDPDRLRTPVRRRADGSFEPIDWEQALDLVGERLTEIRRHHGADAVAVYMGNPIVHNHGALLLRQAFLKALGTHNATSAGSQDTSPRFAASWYLYGSSISQPVPDVDRTDYFLCVGANPLVSNGSFLSAPDVRGRLRRLRERGGKVVVVDPRRTETAERADEQVAVRPGSDAALLLALTQVLVAEGRVDRARVTAATDGWSEVERRLAAFTPERVAPHAGVEAATIRRVAREFADAPTGVAYSRIGVCNNRYGTLASYATDLLNLAAGRLGAVGGALFPRPAFDLAPILRLLGGDGHGRWRSRVRGLPETLGDVPASTLAEEMETPGPGQVRAFVTYAGNPVLSTPNGARLARALARLDFMVSIDLYVNETTRHADVILPPAGHLAEDHIDLVFSNFFVRNVARYSPPVVAKRADQRHDWEILLAITQRLGGGPTGAPALDALYRLGARLGLRWSPRGTLDLVLRTGPYGDRFLPWSKGLNLKKLAAAPHGIDLGPLEPGVARRIYHRDGRIHVGAAPFLAELDALAAEIATAPAVGDLLLIGRRELRTSNSWIHNVPAMVAGAERCLLYVHPDDAARAGLTDGEVAELASRVHRGPVKVRVTDEMRPGVVSLPHGWGHAPAAPWQRVAGAHPGVSVNDWTDDQLVEGVVGQAVLNGVPVRLHAVAAAAA
jgi:anaerobic selenocysteine-containing dehydrogenase